VTGKSPVTGGVISAETLAGKALDDGETVLESLQLRKLFRKPVILKRDIDKRAGTPGPVPQFRAIGWTHIMVFKPVRNKIELVNPG
jgi:hypothetical protein